MHSSAQQPRRFWIAFLLNFLLPGAGHIYVGNNQHGVWLIVGNVLGWTLVPFGVGFVPVIGTWLYSLATIDSECKKYNESFVAAEAAAEGRRQAEVDIAEILGLVNSASQLLSAGMINAEEFTVRKLAAISLLSVRRLREPADQLLLALVPYRAKGLLSDDELTRIKTLLAAPHL